MKPTLIARIISFIPLLFTCLIPLFNKNKIPTVSVVIVLILTFIIILLQGNIEALIENLNYRIKNIYSSFMYHSINVKMEYLKDDGSLVSYSRHDHIGKISLRKSVSLIELSMEFDGTIVKDKTTSINSFFTFPSNNNIIFWSYFNNDNIINKEHYSFYSLCVENGFTEKKQDWVVKTKRYCDYYNVEIIIPANKKILEASLLCTVNTPESNITLSQLRDKDYKWVRVESPKIAIIYAISCTIISVKLTKIKQTDYHKIVWVLD
ncbi:MAG: hypothetical protein MUF12_00460 [Sediminibacterium sp.]|nr:hypothetical protein [Sediminibacterium sp.]